MALWRDGVRRLLGEEHGRAVAQGSVPVRQTVTGHVLSGTAGGGGLQGTDKGEAQQATRWFATVAANSASSSGLVEMASVGSGRAALLAAEHVATVCAAAHKQHGDDGARATMLHAERRRDEAAREASQQTSLQV